MYAIEWSAESPAGLPTLQAGARNESVRILQRLLAQAGYPLVEDGIFGPSTDQAVKDFQRGVDLTQDGVVGWETWEALRNVTASHTTERAGAGGQTISTWVGIGIIGAALILGWMTMRSRGTSR